MALRLVREEDLQTWHNADQLLQAQALPQHVDSRCMTCTGWLTNAGIAIALHCSIETGDSLGAVGMRTVAGTLRMVRMVRLLAVKRSAVSDCRGKMHSHQD